MSFLVQHKRGIIIGAVGGAVVGFLWSLHIPQIVFWWIVIELTCPNFNILSTACGKVTTKFVLERAYWGLVITAAIGGGIRAYQSIKRAWDERS